jgi:TRAP-type uncharacterized transport system substrate-binding protein
MYSRNWLVGLLGIALLAIAGSASAQDDHPSSREQGAAVDDSQPARTPAPVASARPSRTKEFDTAEIAKINAWTVGLAAGQLEGAPLRFATDISRVVDDGDNLHVLPIVTRGPTENVEALLYLKGVDVAIINADTLAQFVAKVPDIQKRITYILSLFPSELHIFVRPDINSLDDLKGKKVNFNTQGTAAAYSGPLIFEKLKLDVQKTFIPHQVALAQMRAGTDGTEAVVFVTSKPVDAFQRGKWPPGFKFLSVPFEDFSFYLPATLTSTDYPQLIPEGQEVQTIAIPTILAAFNWPKGSNRYDRVARLTDYLFDRLDTLQGPGFHPKWKDVVLNAQVPGLTRFRAAQEWLDRTVSAQVASGAPTVDPSDLKLFRQFLQWKAGQVKAQTTAKLFQDFQEWQKTH